MLRSRGRGVRSSGQRRMLKRLYSDGDEEGCPSQTRTHRAQPRHDSMLSSSDEDPPDIGRGGGGGDAEREVPDSEDECRAPALALSAVPWQTGDPNPGIAQPDGATAALRPLERLRKSDNAAGAEAAAGPCGDARMGGRGALANGSAGFRPAGAQRADGWTSESSDMGGVDTDGAGAGEPGALLGGSCGGRVKAGSRRGAAAVRRGNPFVSARTIEQCHAVSGCCAVLAAGRQPGLKLTESVAPGVYCKLQCAMIS